MIETRSVLAGAYEGGARRKHAPPGKCLTHSIEVDEAGRDVRVLCGRVRLDSIADAGADEPEERASRPTCEPCERKDPRFQGAAGVATPSPVLDTRMGCVEAAVVRRRAGT